MQKNTIRSLLKIPEYKVTHIFEKEKELWIWLEPYKRKKFICSNCGTEHKTGFHGWTAVIVEDLSICGYRVFLKVAKRRYQCQWDGHIYNEEVPWIKKWGRITRRFGENVYHLTAITTNQEAGWYLGLDDERVYRIDREMLQEKAKEKLNPVPTGIHLSIDEVSYRKYHRYLTNIIDTDIRKVIWNAKGRKSEVLSLYYKSIGSEACAKIDSVALDGARHYIRSTEQYAVNAMIVYDKFHVVQKLNGTIDAVRKWELREARARKDEELIELTNCKKRFLLFKKPSRLTDKQSSYLEALCKMNEPIYKAMLLKESFLQVYDCPDVEAAKQHLRNWIKDALSSTLEPFKKLAESFTDKFQYLINWFHKKISSAISEGFNNKIKRLKRMAYGYKDIDYFRLKIHQHCGLLNPRIPH